MVRPHRMSTSTTRENTLTETRRTGRLALRVAFAAAFGLAVFGSAAPASAAARSVPAPAYADTDSSGSVSTQGLIWI
jgi:hypothetical protein